MTDPSETRTPFLQRRDWLTFGITLLVSLFVYYRGLPPTVTLEDAGELAVAADYLGVPHPPGYPIWTFLAWFFQWVLHSADYNGYPNPAWAVALMSAVFGALASGIIGMLISRSSRMMVENLRPGTSLLLDQKRSWGIGLVTGLVICSGFQIATSGGIFTIGLLATFVIFASILKGFKADEDQPDFIRRWIPGLPQIGCVLYGAMIGCVGYLMAWNLMAIATVGSVLPLAAGMTLLIFGLMLLLDLAMAKVAERPERLSAVLESRMDVFCGIGGGLLLAFSPLMWSQAEIVEVYSLNAFFMAVLMLLTFWYLCRPDAKILYATAFVFALGLTNHQSLLFLIFFLLAGIAAAKQKTLFADALKLVLFGILVVLAMKMKTYASDAGAIRVFTGFFLYTLTMLVLLFVFSHNFKPVVYKQLGIMALLCVLGLGFHAFMPFASEQNPPMNWGYARTTKGFKHALLRGQYAKFSIADNIRRIEKSMGLPPPDRKEGVTDDTWDTTIEAHRLNRTHFLRQVGVFFTGVGGSDSLYDKYSIANEFSLQFPDGEVDPTGNLPPPPEKEFPFALLGLLPLLMFVRFGDKNRAWFHCCFIGMFFVTIVFMVIQEPQLNHNDLFVKRVQYIQAHALFSVWMAYGVVLLLTLLYGFLPKKTILSVGSLSACILFAWFPIHKNQNDARHIEYLGSSSLNKHDFGWQFGFYQLKGANGIVLDELAHHKNPDCRLTDWSLNYLRERGFSDEQIQQAHDLAGTETWPRKNFVKKVAKKVDGLDSVQCRQLEHAGLLGAYRELSKETQTEQLRFHHAPLPDLNYPPEMDQDAIFFGGTDPGRFVPTYMIYSADCRPDVYLITQNALADPTYLDTMRDLYGDPIWIPSVLDSNQAFREYGDQLRIFAPKEFAAMVDPSGRVQVSGVDKVMKINFILANNIFEQNKWRHTTYVEESYSIPWMYPYLRPNGLILKVEKEPYTLTQDDIQNDFAFWNWYVEKLLETYLPEDKRSYTFRRDLVARKTFSKLRGAIAGMYNEKGHLEEAERAYLQSVELYPASPEANFRLAELYMKRRRFDDAEAIINRFATFDPTNRTIGNFMRGVKQMRGLDEQRKDYEAKQREKPSMQNLAYLLQLYSHLRMEKETELLVNQLLRHPKPHPTLLRMIADLMLQKKDLETYTVALKAIIEHDPKDTQALFDLAAVELSAEHYQEAMNLVAQAVQRGGDEARANARADFRLNELMSAPAFKQLVAPRRRPPSGGGRQFFPEGVGTSSQPGMPSFGGQR